MHADWENVQGLEVELWHIDDYQWLSTIMVGDWGDFLTLYLISKIGWYLLLFLTASLLTKLSV